jgi:4-hydroxysphinganine ceramide fatty acyl 2-hydroxylase
VIAYFFGMFCWTVIEYNLHRFLFHGEDYWLPENNKIIAIHWMMHGIHHTFPSDRYRLVFPIVPGVVTHLVLVISPSLLFVPQPYTYAVIAGISSGYVIYDVMHYFYHHSSPKPGYFRTMKQYHMAHHYRNSYLGFGLTNKFWDVVFDTELKVADAGKDKQY